MITTTTKTTFTRIAVFAISAFAGLSAYASPVSFTFQNFGSSSSVSAHAGDTYISNLSVGTITLANIYREGVPVDTSSVVVFCTEIQESISTGQTYNYDVVEPQYASAGTAGNPGSSSSAIPIGGIGVAAARNVAILYDLYYAGNEASDWNSATVGAFQLAVWELTHDSDGSLSGTDGSFYVTNGNSTVRNLAQSYLDAVGSTSSSYNPYTDLVALSSMGNPGRQDLLVQSQYVGGPVTAVPFGVNPLPGLAIIGFFGWRRLRKRLNDKIQAE